MSETSGRVALACGQRRIEVELPAHLAWETLVASEPHTGVGWRERLPELLDRALARVAASEPSRAKRVVVVVPDETRTAPGPELVSCVVDRLAAHGASPSSVCVLVACGVHRSQAPAGFAESARSAGAALVTHDAEAAGAGVGTTKGGLAIELNPLYAEADLRLTLGGVTLHYFAGFGGGPKMIFPGVAARHGVAGNHRRALAAWPPGGLHPGCAPGTVTGNPVAEEIAEAAHMAPAHGSVHWVAGGGEWTLFEGDDGLDEARRTVLAAGTRGDAGAADCVVASAGGAPWDGDLVQSHKALFHAAAFCREGGSIVLWAEAAGGAGSASLARWLGIETLPELEERARAAYDLNAQTAISLRRLGERFRVLWRGGACPEWIAAAGATVTESDGEAWRLAEAACRESGGFSRGVVLPRATALVPRIGSRAEAGRARTSGR